MVTQGLLVLHVSVVEICSLTQHRRCSHRSAHLWLLPPCRNSLEKEAGISQSTGEGEGEHLQLVLLPASGASRRAKVKAGRWDVSVCQEAKSQTAVEAISAEQHLNPTTNHLQVH